MPFSDEISYGDKYDPAMGITDQTTADAYFESCVQHAMEVGGKSREEAEKFERDNLGYWAGYYGEETRARVEELFSCAHPFFGSIKEFGSPTPEQAFSLGKQFGEITKIGRMSKR